MHVRVSQEIRYNSAMKIDSTEIVDHIFEDLRHRVGELQKRNIMPHLVVIFVGNNPSSAAYIKQKEKKAEAIGAKVTVMRFGEDVTSKELEEKISLLNADPFVHGILIQRPLPKHIDEDKLDHLTEPQKDIDGFHPDSPYTLPLPLAVEKILEYIYAKYHPEPVSESPTKGNNNHDKEFITWLAEQNIVIIGKGSTGGKPIITYLRKLKLNPQIIDSKTTAPDEILKHADVVISAVGKPGALKAAMLKRDVILIGVGMSQTEEKKLQGDYVEAEIADIASFYTPTPKGVGPVNVAMLMDTLVTATEKQTEA